MKKFVISIPEVHYANVPVEAETLKEAFEKAQNAYGDGDFDLEFSHCIDDTSRWKHEEVNE